MNMNIRKRILSLLATILLTLSAVYMTLPSPVFADEINSNTNNNNTIPSVFTEVFTPLSISCYDITITNSFGDDVTDSWIFIIEKYAYAGNHLLVKDLLDREGLSITAVCNKPVLKASRRQHFYKTFNEIGSAGGYTKEWIVGLGGSITYNLRTNKITSASTPTIGLVNANFGTAFSPWIGNISTGRTVYTSKVLFYASYNMYAGIDFGNYNVSFYAYPSF
mgnify:CR=1 FL=1